MALPKISLKPLLRTIRPFVSNKLVSVIGGAVVAAIGMQGNSAVVEQAQEAREAAAATVQAAADAVESFSMAVSTADAVLSAAQASQVLTAVVGVVALAVVGAIEKLKDVIDNALREESKPQG